MAWNYRVMRHEEWAPDGSGESVVTYMMHEVFYDEDGRVDGWTAEGANVIADTRRGLFEILAMMSEGIARPVLDAKTGHEIEPATELGDSMKRVIEQIRAEEADPATDQPPVPE